MIKLGMIGLGGMAHEHVRSARKSGRFEIKAAADIAQDGTRAKQLGIPDFYKDYKELLKDPEIDAVVIASPHDCHVEHCTAAFAAGKHVLVEKPIARDLREAQIIIDACEKSGKVGMVGFNERYEDRYVTIKHLLDSNTFGKLLSARVDHYQDVNPAPGSWWRNKEKVGGGAVIGSGIHRLDLCRWYFGEAVSVYAKAVHMPKRLEAEVCAHAVIEFESGVIVNFSINWAAYEYLYYEGMSISGEDGLVVVGPAEKIGLAHSDNGKLKDMELEEAVSIHTHFADCIEKGISPLTSLEEGYRSLQLVRAIYRSMETGKPVDPRTITE